MPEIDQQLSQAIAARQQTAASLDLARSTVERWEACARRMRYRNRSWTNAAAATRRPAPILPRPKRTSSGCVSSKAFKRVVAPFSGVITRRNVDVGDLIDAGSGGGGAGAVPARADRSAARLHQRAAGLLADGQARPEGGVTQAELRGRTSRARSRARPARSTRRRERCRSRCAAQSRRRAAAGRLRAGAIPLAASARSRFRPTH